jgi:hypothetical protein
MFYLLECSDEQVKWSANTCTFRAYLRKHLPWRRRRRRRCCSSLLHSEQWRWSCRVVQVQDAKTQTVARRYYSYGSGLTPVVLTFDVGLVSSPGISGLNFAFICHGRGRRLLASLSSAIRRIWNSCQRKNIWIFLLNFSRLNGRPNFMIKPS